jgi:hypothetical protein
MPGPARILIATVVISALLVNVYILVESIVFPERLSPDISKYESRFIPLAQTLSKHGVVGYIDDGDKELSTTRFYIARYAISPVIVARSIDYPLVVGNFPGAAPDFETYRKKGLVPIRDFGDGVILFKRELR